MTGIPLRETDSINVSKREGDWPARLALMAAGLFCLLLLGLAWAVLAGKVGGGDLRQSVDGLNAGLAEVGTKQEATTRDVSDLTKRVDTMSTNVDKLKADMATVKDRTEGVARVEDKLSSMEKQLTSVTEALNKINNDRTQWQMANETMATHIAATRESANAAAETSRATAARVDAIDREVKDMQRVVADMQAGRTPVAAPVAVAALPAPSNAMTAQGMNEAQPAQPAQPAVDPSANPAVASNLPSTQPGGNTVIVMEQPVAPAPVPSEPAQPAQPEQAPVVAVVPEKMTYSRPTDFPPLGPCRMSVDSEPHSDNIATVYSPYDYRYVGVGPVRPTQDAGIHSSTDYPPEYTKMTEPYFPDGHGVWGTVEHREAHYAKDAELRRNHGEPWPRGGHSSADPDSGGSPDRLNQRYKKTHVGRNYAQNQYGPIGWGFDAVGNTFVWIGEHVDAAFTGTKYVD